MHERDNHMTRTLVQRLALLLTASFATLLVALALTSTSASASPFCGGQTISNIQSCFGEPRTFRILEGYGDSTSVCVGYNEIFGPCSSGPGVLTIWDLGAYAYRYPKIIGNARSNTVGHGDAF